MRPPDFDSLAQEYARHRTGYSDALFARLRDGAPPAPRVLDAASGTGLAARGLAAFARRVVGADVARRMLSASPLADRAQARGEALPFRDGTFDLVACAQSFHWLDPLPAYREFRRVLAEGGLVAVWWKLEVPDDPVARLSEEAFREATGRDMPRTEAARRPLPHLDESPFPRVEEARLPASVAYTVDTYVGYHASRENFRRGAGPLRERALALLRARLREALGDATFEVAHEQRLWLLRT